MQQSQNESLLNFLLSDENESLDENELLEIKKIRSIKKENLLFEKLSNNSLNQNNSLY
jgi:hypothetical protein